VHTIGCHSHMMNSRTSTALGGGGRYIRAHPRTWDALQRSAWASWQVHPSMITDSTSQHLCCNHVLTYCLIILQDSGAGGGPGGRSPEEIVGAAAAEILDKLPPDFDLEAAQVSVCWTCCAPKCLASQSAFFNMERRHLVHSITLRRKLSVYVPTPTLVLIHRCT
jgi:hypothetical protein